MRIILWSLLILISYHSEAQCSSETVQKLKKSALVIGENDYADEPLTHPVNDAIDVAKTLYALGFDTIVDLNISKSRLVADIQKWVLSLKKKNIDVAFFYFGGHAAEVKGNNYLFPIDARGTRNEDSVIARSYLVSTLLSDLEFYNSHVNVVVLDACRHDPTKSFTKSLNRHGLREMPKLKSGVLIGFPVPSGTEAPDGAPNERNGIYAKALIDNLGRPNITLTDVFARTHDDVYNRSNFKQIPFINSSIGNDNNFCLSHRDYGNKQQNESAFTDSIISNGLDDARKIDPTNSDDLEKFLRPIFDSAHKAIALGDNDAYDSVKSFCKCQPISAYKDNRFPARSFENSDGFRSEFYFYEFRPRVHGIVEDHDISITIEDVGTRTEKLVALEKKKGIYHMDSFRLLLGAPNWELLREHVRNFFLERVEMFR